MNVDPSLWKLSERDFIVLQKKICIFFIHTKIWVRVQSLGQKNALENGMETHSSILARRIHPKDRGFWQAAVHRVSESQTRPTWLNAAQHIVSNMANIPEASDITQALWQSNWYTLLYWSTTWILQVIF